MIICHCRRVSDRKIRRLVASGADDVDDIGTRCGAGTVCGGCVLSIAEIVASSGVPRVSVQPA